MSRSRATTFLLACMAVGCDSGSRRAGLPPLCPGECRPPLALYSVSPLEACAGETIALEGEGFSTVPDEDVVVFRSQKDTHYALRGVVRSATKRRLLVTVPGGALNGTVELSVLDDQGILRHAGAAEFGGCPMVTGIAIGADGRDGVIELAGTQILPDDVLVHGYNLENAVTADFEDASGTIAARGVPVTSVTLPSPGQDRKLSAVRAGIPGALIFLGLDAYEVRVRIRTPEKTSSWGSFIIRRPRARAGAIIAGVAVPSGIRSGIVEARYATFVEESPDRLNTAPWDLIAEYSTNGGQSWSPATSAGSAEGDDRTSDLIPGDRAFPSESGLFAGPGLAYRFLWDPRADLAGMRTLVRLRFRLVATDPSQSNVTNTFESPSFLVDDTGTASSGEIVEPFDDREYEDSDRTTASWADPPGVSAGAIDPRPDAGSGTDDLVLEPKQFFDEDGAYRPAYLFDTDSGRLGFELRDGRPWFEFAPFIANPGALEGELHLRTLEIPEGVVLKSRGSRPLVIRISGTGDPGAIAFALEGRISLDGAGGDPGGGDGRGGEGAAGGGSGGDGGIVTLGMDSLVESARHATGGEGPSAGRAGQTVAYRVIDPGAIPTLISNAFGGAGGGGSHAIAGTAGQSGGTPGLPPRRSGGAGTPCGTGLLVPLFGGSGGGGGGGSVHREAGAFSWEGDTGSGGGGGGGALRIIVAGSARVDGEISADGGDGGARRGRGGSGGGGSGGAILVQATGKIEFGARAGIHARGGAGGDSGAGPISARSIGGWGGEGRIRFEGASGMDLPGLVDPSALAPSLDTPSATAGMPSEPIDAGAGDDGALAFAPDAAGTFLVDTDANRITNLATGVPVIGSASREGEFRFASLSIPPGVTLRAVGSRPLWIRVAGDAAIEGRIDVSGFDASEADATSGLPGNPGAAGPGGGAGGMGGTVAASGEMAHGRPGRMPALLPLELIAVGPTYGSRKASGVAILPPLTAPALGGETIGDDKRARTAGGGGGGGHALEGADGDAAGAEASAGSGGLAFGSPYFRSPIDGSGLPLGGSGGAGGGASAATRAPGTCGGGGGEFVRVAVGGALRIASGASIEAKGGDAFATLPGGGNGGAGAGGGVFIQVAGLLVIERGASIDVRGGKANRTPLAYATGTSGSGGDGAPGRIRIETSAGIGRGAVAIEPAAAVGSFRAHRTWTLAASKAYRLTFEGSAHDPARILGPEIDFAGGALPAGTEAFLLLEGARESEDSFGMPGLWRGPTFDRTLLDGSAFIRFDLWLASDRATAAMPAVGAVRIRYAR